MRQRRPRPQGRSLQAEAAAVVETDGGRVLGSAGVPFPATDFSSFLPRVQISGAKVVGLANADEDMIDAVKQAHEFGSIDGGQKLVASLIDAADIGPRRLSRSGAAPRWSRA